MLQFLTQIPCEVLGQNMLVYLEMIDIIQLENASASHESQKLLKAIFPYCPPAVVTPVERFELTRESIKWFNSRCFHVHFVKVNVESLYRANYKHCVFNNIKLCLNRKIDSYDIKTMENMYIKESVTCLEIEGDENSTMIEVLFSQLSALRSLRIQASNLSQWFEHINKIGQFLHTLFIAGDSIQVTQSIKPVMEYCPNLEKLSVNCVSAVSESNFLQSIARNSPHLRSLDIFIDYQVKDEFNSDLTAFAEKCPQLEELCLFCEQLTDQSVLTLAQHFSRLKKLQWYGSQITVASLVTLSERGLPLEELKIPWIPIPSSDIAAQCAHALSRIRELNTLKNDNHYIKVDVRYTIQYMTELRLLRLWDSKDHLLLPYMLQPGHCANIQDLAVWTGSSITPQRLSKLVTMCPQLHSLYINLPTCISDTVLVALAHSCPKLQRVILDSNNVTEEGVLTLASHCRQLQNFSIHQIVLSNEGVAKIFQFCRNLKQLHVMVTEGKGALFKVCHKSYTSKEIRALKERRS